ncbi:mucin [Trichoderma cornu-damae]|uniref:Mucin n=1 Tax=Trichoderma cornu-damae TaxID=654480 RepID=A0A9P8TUT6_9HYPO|nr:mucin [Trichoderma cornu-damae]
MPYNTRRKSLSLPSLGIHIPVTHASRASSKSASRGATSSASATPAPTSASRSESPEAHPTKRLKRSHAADAMAIENTPPPSPARAISEEMTDADAVRKIDVEGIKDDIVEAVVVQLQSTGNRPHLVKELATVLTQTLTSVQQSANPCAIISSRLASYIKRTCWSASAPCPLGKELETVHPRRTYYFLTNRPRQPLPDFSASLPVASLTPSASLTEDSGSEDIEARRRELSPSPEVDLSATEFDNADDDAVMPMTPIGSYSSHRSRIVLGPRNNSPPLEKDEREFTQTADGLQKRKLSEEAPQPETAERHSVAMMDFYRDDVWFADSRPSAATTFLASPSIKPSISAGRKEEDADAWLRLNKLFEWGKGAESIEIDELDCLLDAC